MPFVVILFSLLFLSEPGSKVTWLGPTEVELGSIQKMKPVYVRFPFRNVTQQAITIDNIRTGCGCTAPEWSEAAVAPGDTSSILIEFDAEKTGYFRQWIRVYIHDQRSPERLWVEGEVLE
ncbi:MAG: DUF1573 domain-containing protein [Saprospirales bacterium]|nr:DUF1573 domain-containing protein [Saprospirales bacterium]